MNEQILVRWDSSASLWAATFPNTPLLDGATVYGGTLNEAMAEARIALNLVAFNPMMEH